MPTKHRDHTALLVVKVDNSLSSPPSSIFTASLPRLFSQMTPPTVICTPHSELNTHFFCVSFTLKGSVSSHVNFTFDCCKAAFTNLRNTSPMYLLHHQCTYYTVTSMLNIQYFCRWRRAFNIFFFGGGGGGGRRGSSKI